MLKFSLLAIHLATASTGNPDVYVLDHDLTIEDCGQAIETAMGKSLVWLDEKNAVNTSSVTFACELESAK